MAVTGKMYTNGLVGFIKGDFKWLTSAGSTFKVALMQTGFSGILNQDTNVFWSDVSAQEIGATGNYATGGATLTTSDPTVDAATNEIRLDAADVTWATSTITAYYAVIYQSTGVAGTSRLLGYVDFGGVQSSSAADFKITWHADGIFAVAAA